MKSLLIKKQAEQQLPTKPTIKIEPISDYPQEKRRKTEGGLSSEASKNEKGKPYQAYFCRKCYKVFYKLDEFDVHVLACSGRMNTEECMTASSKPGPKPRPAPALTPPPGSKPYNRPGPKSTKNQLYDDNPPVIDGPLSTSGRPIRNCVREITRYVDEPVLDPEWIEDEKPEEKPKAKSTHGQSLKTENGYACGICSSCFPTSHSRNSHMRIHKRQTLPMATSEAIKTQSHAIAKKRAENVAQKVIQVLTVGPGSKPLHRQASAAKPAPTPAPTAAGLSNIMKLVQNNPHLTIKSMAEKNPGSPQHNQRASTSTVPQRTAPVPPLRATVPQPQRSHIAPPQTSNSIPSHKKPGPKPRILPPRVPPPLIIKSPTPNDNAERKNYRCQGCHKPFANKSNLYFHKKNYCTGSRFPCPLCKKRFGSEEAYNSHLYYSHPE